MNVRSRTRVLRLIAGMTAGLSFVSTVIADDDDQKIRDWKPPVFARAYHAPTGSNPADGPFQNQNVLLQAWLPLNSFPGVPADAHGADCWGYVSPSGREYALMGLSWGNGIVEVTNPSSPVILTVIPGGVNVLWRDITVVGNRAYAVSDSSGVGIQVMDLSNIDNGQVTFLGNISQGGHTTTHTLLSNPDSGYLYACGGNANGGGMIPCSLTNPNIPSFTGPGWNTQYVHEAQIVNYVTGPYAGKEIAFLYTGGPYYGEPNGLAIVDVTNKAAPAQLSFIKYPGIRFSHQGWLSEDRKYLYQDDELDAPSSGAGNVPRGLTRVFDVSNLSNPRMCATFSNGLPSVDHNQYVNGRYLYQSNYTSGMHVWDMSDPLRPVRVAWIDTRPEDDGTGYNGAWGNFPFFPSGTVLISDLERGLFVVKISILEVNPVGTPPSVLAPNTPTPITVQVAARDAAVNPATVQLNVSVNGGSYSAISMSPVGNGQYAASIPGGACFDRVRYYVTAQTTDARTFSYPLRGASEPRYATVVTSASTIFSDNFETDKGWTVANTNLTAGAWVRAVPLANGGQGAVIGDADGSGRAFVTGNTLDEDVDGGPTRLTSPAIDLSGAPEAVVSYARWVLSIQGTTDNLIVEVSNNNGSTWTQVESVGPSSGAWRYNSFRVADYVTPTAQVRLRFSIADTGNDSQTEAGLDDVRVVSPACAATCYADCNGDGVLGLADFGCFQTKFALNDPYADCNGDGVLGLADFGCFQTKFALGCP
jgi:choice-of-anchor B domain-containing protein